MNGGGFQYSVKSCLRTGVVSFLLLITLATPSPGEPPVITGLVQQAPIFELKWDSPTNRNIVASSPVVSGPYEFITPVLSNNAAVVTNHLSSSFFRVRRVVVVHIPDTNVAQGVRNAVTNKYEPTDELYDFELIAVTNLSPTTILIGKNVTDLTGLEYTWLDSLNLSNNTNLSDLAPLAGLTGLRRLDFLSNKISDLSPLAGLTNLTSLEFPFNLVSDIGPLSNMTYLIRLSMFNNQVSDLSPLAGLTNLLQLFAYNNLISDISPLAGLTQMLDLRLNNNSITDIDSLSSMTNLLDLRLHNNLITNIGALVTNSLNDGIGTGTLVRLQGNPLSSFALTNDIPILTNRGVVVLFDP